MPNEHNRVGISGTVYHQVSGSNPTGNPLRCSMNLSSPEEAFSRTPPNPIGKKWEVLDLGWLPKCSMLCIRNLEKPDGFTLHLGFRLSGDVSSIGALPLIVPPGMLTVLYPTDKLALCCPNGEAHYSLFAVPE